MKKIDFSKYDKGLRYYATLFKLNPIIFDTDLFVDVEVSKLFFTVRYKGYPDESIRKIIEENEFFYNDILDKGVCYRFKPKTKNQEVDYNLMKTNGTYFCNKDFILDIAILWKDYLDDSFHDIVNHELVSQLHVQEKAG